jgi:hypothetical protein
VENIIYNRNVTKAFDYYWNNQYTSPYAVPNYGMFNNMLWQMYQNTTELGYGLNAGVYGVSNLYGIETHGCIRPSAYVRLPGLFNVNSHYNPTQIVIQTLNILTRGNGLLINKDTKNYKRYENIINETDLGVISSDILTSFLLTRCLCVEVVNTGEELKFIIHDPRNCTARHDALGNLVYIKITGKVNDFNKATGEFETRWAVKEYFAVKESDYYACKIDGEEVDGYELDFIPVVYTEKGKFDIQPLFNLIDKFNENKELIRNTGRINGAPIIVTTSPIKDNSPYKDPYQQTYSGTSNIAATSNQAIDTNNWFQSNYTDRRVIVLQDVDGRIEFLEADNTTIDKLTLDNENTMKLIELEYPESSLASLLEGSHLSSQSVKLKISTLIAKVSFIREDFAKVLANLLEICYKFKYGKVSVSNSIKAKNIIFKDTISFDSEAETIQNLVQLVQSNIVTPNEARENIPVNYSIKGGITNGTEPANSTGDTSTNSNQPTKPTEPNDNRPRETNRGA